VYFLVLGCILLTSLISASICETKALFVFQLPPRVGGKDGQA